MKKLWVNIIIVLTIISVIILSIILYKRIRSDNSKIPHTLLQITNQGSPFIPAHKLTIFTDGSGAISCLTSNNCKSKTLPKNMFNVKVFQNLLSPIGDVRTIPTSPCPSKPLLTITITINDKMSGNILCIANDAQTQYLILKQDILNTDITAIKK